MSSLNVNLFNSGKYATILHLYIIILFCFQIVSAPVKVAAPVVTKIQGGKVTVVLKSASEKDGPLSHYDLIVVQMHNANQRPQDFTLDELEVTNLSYLSL